MANGALPYSIEKSSFTNIPYFCLSAVVVAGATDEHKLNERIKGLVVKNTEGQTVAIKYSTSQIFTFQASERGTVLQIVTDGNVNVNIQTSLDGVNWDTPTGFTTITGLTSSQTIRMFGLGIQEHIKITVTRNSGSYYINVLQGGDN